MPPKATPKVNVAPRLPPLPKLRVRRPNKTEANPCAGIMSSVLGCWASNGQSAEGCIALEQQLRACMDQPVSGMDERIEIGEPWADGRCDVATEAGQEEQH